MKASYFIKPAIVILAMIFSENKVSAQADSVKAANEWVKSHVWANGLKVEVYPDVNSVEFEKQYKLTKDDWDKAFAFLADSAKLATLAPGNYPIDGKNVYASITEGPSKAPEVAKWESHRKYIDLQYVIRGAEKIEVMPLASATVTEPYNETKDAAHYSGNGKYYTATPAMFYLFFPGDVHRPNIRVDGYDVVKKLVIKIRYIE